MEPFPPPNGTNRTNSNQLYLGLFIRMHSAALIAPETENITFPILRMRMVIIKYLQLNFNKLV